MISDASEILHKLLEGGHSTVAGRLAGAFRNIGNNIIADNIIEAMRTAGYNITENDPFEERPTINFSENELFLTMLTVMRTILWLPLDGDDWPRGEQERSFKAARSRV